MSDHKFYLSVSQNDKVRAVFRGKAGSNSLELFAGKWDAWSHGITTETSRVINLGPSSKSYQVGLIRENLAEKYRIDLVKNKGGKKI
jgi:hypothetical protein